MRIRPVFFSTFALLLLACVAGCGSTAGPGIAVDTSPTGDAAATTPGPVAYAFFGYAGSAYSSPGIQEFAMEADGSITNMPGATLAASPAGLTSNGNYLYVADEGTQSIRAFRIASSGISPAATTSAAKQGYPAWLFVDRSGKTLYSWGGSGGKNTYAAWSIGTNGALTLIHQVPANINGPWPDAQLSFSGNDKWAYNSACIDNAPVYYGFTRSPSGALTAFNTEAATPAGTGGNKWCPTGAAANGSGAVVIGMNPSQSSAGSLLAVYGIQSNGTLKYLRSTKLPTSPQYLSAYVFDPTGSWLAAGDGAGLHLYHFVNDVLTLTDTASIEGGVQQIAWDRNGNIYWLGQACCGSFAVYSASSTGKLTEQTAASSFAPEDPGEEGGTYMTVHPL